MKVKHSKYPELGIMVVDDEYPDGRVSVERENGAILVFPFEELTEVSSQSQTFVYRGEEKIPLSEVKDDQIECVLEGAKDWTTVYAQVLRVTKQFSEYRMADGSPLNQGGFDPMFCTTAKNPGYFIREGLLIFRKAAPGSGCTWEYKTRAAASEQEIQDCVDLATEKNKFIFEEKTNVDNDRCGIQTPDSFAVAGGV